MRKYHIQDRQTGTIFEYFDTYEEAAEGLQRHEAWDIWEGLYEEDFYEIVDENGEEVII